MIMEAHGLESVGFFRCVITRCGLGTSHPGVAKARPTDGDVPDCEDA